MITLIKRCCRYPVYRTSSTISVYLVRTWCIIEELSHHRRIDRIRIEHDDNRADDVLIHTERWERHTIGGAFCS